MTPDTIMIVAKTLWGEARGEPAEGKIAVAWVIRNRAAKPRWWGHNLTSVCLKPMQFSCWNQNDPNASKLRRVTLDTPSLLRCFAYAAGVMADLYPDPTGGSTHYHVDNIHPSWADGLTETVRIGRHVFYKEA